MIKTARCQRCETLPDPLQGPGQLHLKFPIAHSLGKALVRFRELGWTYAERQGTVTVDWPAEKLDALVTDLMESFSSMEKEHIKALYQPAGRTLGLDDYFEIGSLATFISKARSPWLIRMMGENRLTSVFQPILYGQDRERVFAYECLLRGQEGEQTVYPGQILEVARGAELLFQLDLAARRTAIRAAAAHGITDKIFINFTPTSIYDPAYCLRSTVATVQAVGIDPNQIVFEVIESEHIPDVRHLKAILDTYRAAGFGVALDDLGSGYSSLNILGELRPDYVKLDMELTRNVHADPYKALIVCKLLETARELGMWTIAEGVETEADYQWLRQHRADYVQGYLFARPSAKPLPRSDARSRTATLAGC